jgi:hypothetical protein
MRKALVMIAVVALGATAVMAEPMQGGPYPAPTEPYVACSRDGFSGTQGANGWYYGYVSHGDTWSNIPDHLTLFDKFDPGQGPTGQWSVQNPGPNENLLKIDKLGQTKAGGLDAYNTVRYWVADTPVSTSDVLGGVIELPGSPAGVRAWVKIYDASADATIDVADNWGSGGDFVSGDILYYFAPQQIDIGDWVMFGIGHTGGDQGSDGAIQEWHQHVTPEPAALAMFGLAGLALIRRKR